MNTTTNIPQVGGTYENFGCTWEVIRRYRMPDEIIREFQLWYPNRITVRCIRSNGVIPVGEIRDFADHEQED